MLDLSWVVAGPLVGRTLAGHGAEVVRVESSRRIETSRLMPPFHGGVPGVENSALFGNANAGKYGLALDLGKEAGRAVAADLAAWADVVVESFSPGRMARWGLGQETLRAHNPRLIVLSSSLMGQTGPHAALAGYDSTGAPEGEAGMSVGVNTETVAAAGPGRHRRPGDKGSGRARGVLRRPGTWLSLAWITVVVLGSLSASVLAPHDPLDQNLRRIYQGPSARRCARWTG
ncbi:CoA transferase [Streptomyces sp. BRA346]